MLISIFFNKGIGGFPKSYGKTALAENFCNSVMGSREDQREEENLRY